MKRLLSVSLLAMVVATGAHGADLPRYELPGTEVSNSVNWTGFSIGVQGGVLNGTHEVSVSDGEDSATLNGLASPGLVGRVTAQWDAQLGDWVAGVRGHYGFSNAETTLDVTDPDFSASLARGDDYGGVLRFGPLLGQENRTLLYGLAGWQWSEYELSAPGLSQTESYDGALAGVGIEHALNDFLFVGIEYNHWFAGEQPWLEEAEGLTVVDDLSEDTVTATLRAKF